MRETRKPTGEVSWPKLLIEGGEGTGKTYNSLRFSQDPRLGAFYAIEVGEHRFDEYAPLGNFEIVPVRQDLDDIVAAIYEVMAEPPLEGRPNVLLIDSGTALWDLDKRKAEAIAKSSRAAQQKLQEDPNAEIDVGHQAWNKAKDRWWWGWLNDMRAWPGIVLITARAEEVSKFVDGRPVANQTEYRIDIEKGTPYILDATVRMRGEGTPPLVTMKKSLMFQMPKEGLELRGDDPLAELVFDHFKAGTTVVLNVAQAKKALVSRASALGHSTSVAEGETLSAAGRAAAEAWKAVGITAVQDRFDAELINKLIEALPVPTTEPDDAATDPGSAAPDAAAAPGAADAAQPPSDPPAAPERAPKARKAAPPPSQDALVD